MAVLGTEYSGSSGYGCNFDTAGNFDCREEVVEAHYAGFGYHSDAAESSFDPVHSDAAGSVFDPVDSDGPGSREIG